MTRTGINRWTARLHLEHLEDRSVPAIFTVNTTLDDVTPANGKQSLREAITRANTSAGADMIVVPAGLYKLTQAGTGEDANATGDLDITDAVTIQGAGAGLTIIDAQRLDRVIEVLSSAPNLIAVVLQGMTVRRGNASGHGGGIWVNNADLVVRDCVVSECRASVDGGGISNESALGTGNITVVRTTVALNVAGDDGGGIDMESSNGVLTIKSSTIRRNLSDFGGGINAKTVTATGSTINGNVTTSFGGGIYATTATLTNCTVAGNSAGEKGGGIDANAATLLNCTIVENFSHTGGGLYNDALGTFSVKNTIVALNLVDATGTAPDLSGVYTDGGHNLIGIGSGSTGIFTGLNGNFVGTMANSIDPKLGPLQNNGGPTKTMALLSGSKAIDAGDNAGAPGVDQRGHPRVKDGNFDGSAIVDIGAFEK
jgi:CSLREA domain-containing protein